MPGRLDNLKQLVEESPDDPLALYGLAMEYRRIGSLEAASRFPAYGPQYLMHGQVLEAMARPDAAREAYRLGIDKANEQGELHARTELEAALSRVTT